MCDDGLAEYACADRHEARGEDRARLKEIKRCLNVQNNNLPVCAVRDRAHDWQDDDDTQDCPECRGETPPETP
jgi:RNA polymerase subunit RPABC4/transcription elongation factor Spt4